MSKYFVARYGKIKGEKHLLVALQHNLRETVNLGCGIDPSKSKLNYNLGFAGNSQSKLDMCKRLISDAGVKLRKDAVIAVELMVSISSWDADRKVIFNEIFEWAQTYYGVPIISFNVHFDERFPHCHLLLLPLVEGRMNGSKLVGYKAKLAMMKKSIENSVMRFHGILSSDNSDPIKSNKILGKKIIKRLRDDPIKNSVVWEIVKQQIYKNPKLFKFLLNPKSNEVLNC